MVKMVRREKIDEIFDILPKAGFIFQIIFAVILSFWGIYNNSPSTGDDIEHAHSAWLVSQGKVPYIDFFQHHNPLLWYLFAPLSQALAYDVTLLDVTRIITTLVMFVTIFISAKITTKFLSYNWYAGVLTIASVFPSYVFFSGQDFRPDNYMVMTFILGMYFYFSYLKEHKLNKLVLSFLCMFVSFMFMQKIIFILIFFGGIVLYHLYKKEITLKDFGKSIILPILGALFFISWLCYHGMLEKYWVSNYIFNLYIPDVYGNLVEKTKAEFYVLSFIAFMGCFYFLIKGNRYARIISILWLAEAFQRFFYFSLDRHYYYLLQIFDAILVGAFSYQMIKKIKFFGVIFLILSIIGTINFSEYVFLKKIEPPYHRYVTPKYVVEQTNPCDSVLNGYGLTYNIFNKDITYYWNLNGQLDVIGAKIGLAPLPDLNRAVEENLPKIIYTEPYWDEKLHQKKINVAVHQIDPYIRDKYYEQSAFVGIFILKQKYQNQRRCRYDVTTDSWEYFYKENR